MGEKVQSAKGSSPNMDAEKAWGYVEVTNQERYTERSDQ